MPSRRKAILEFGETESDLSGRRVALGSPFLPFCLLLRVGLGARVPGVLASASALLPEWVNLLGEESCRLLLSHHDLVEGRGFVGAARPPKRAVYAPSPVKPGTSGLRRVAFWNWRIRRARRFDVAMRGRKRRGERADLVADYWP